MLDDIKKLIDLYKDLEQKLKDLGFDFERTRFEASNPSDKEKFTYVTHEIKLLGR